MLTNHDEEREKEINVTAYQINLKLIGYANDVLNVHINS